MRDAVNDTLVTVAGLVDESVVVPLTVMGSGVAVPKAVGLNVTATAQVPPGATVVPLQASADSENGSPNPVTLLTFSGSAPMGLVTTKVFVVVRLAPTSTVPDGVAVTLWPKAAPPASRSAAAASPDLITRDLRILNRIVVLPKS
ncbi:MAG TPA: hypothetical protein VN959_01900 [Mycobacterium sp.]|nr:hypothetical protein [Mycobacterium sp.]